MVDIIDFEDLEEDEIKVEPTMNVTFKVTVSTSEMLKKIAKRERRNVNQLGAIIIEEYINSYVEKYKKSKDS